MSRNIKVKQSVDWITILLYVVLVFSGWLSIYGASYDFDQSSVFDFDHRAGKQFVWILSAFALAGFVLLIDYKIYNSLITNFIYIAVIFLLILTIFVAPDIKGSRSWLVFGPISFQPAELAKVATALAVSRFLSEQGKFSKKKNIILAALIILVPFALIILQKETGSALVFAAFLLVFYREGMSGIVLLSGVFAIFLFIIIVRFGDIPIGFANGDMGIIIAMLSILIIEFIYVFFFRRDKKEALIMLAGVAAITGISLILNVWITVNFNYIALLTVAASCIYWGVLELSGRLRKYYGILIFIVGAALFCFAADYMFDSILKPHQQTRIKIVLNMEEDLSGAGYNVNQSKIAIGSGGFLGKGFLNGTQTKLKYVPEQDTDFIFCTVGEEFGFVGSTAVLLLFVFLLLRLIFIAERQRETFNRIYGYSVVSILFFHIMVNVGMVLGLMPVIGIPLPFFSYGGSSLWAFTILLFIMLRLDASRSERF